jgi:hypothetical protein
MKQVSIVVIMHNINIILQCCGSALVRIRIQLRIRIQEFDGKKIVNFTIERKTVFSYHFERIHFFTPFFFSCG